ncbi:MAG: hypothetical protein Q6370_010765 [Candidatus Sigynarchaeota archaeon]|jgi:hypothetical protein
MSRSEITPERIAWFAEYYKRNPRWGIFRLPLYEQNYWIGVSESDEIQLTPPYSLDELREAIKWFNGLSLSQRRRLGQRAEDLANTIIR